MAEKAKIAILGEYPPPYGGVSTNVMQLTNLLRSDRYDVKVFAERPHQKDKSNNIFYYRLWEINPNRNLLRHLREYGPDLMHSHQSSLRVSFAVLSELLNVPIIHQVYGERFPVQFRKASGLKKLSIRWAINEAKYVIAASQELEDFLVRISSGMAKICTIPCLLPLENSKSIEKDLLGEKKKDNLVLVTTGFYPYENEHYGFDLIPSVATQLKKAGVNFIWLLVGQGSVHELNIFRRELEDKDIQENVILINELDRSNMLNLLKKTHIYVRTKYSDSFGVVIAEAHQLGCHCLFGDNNPYFNDGYRLTKYKSGDTKSLYNKLLEIIKQIDINEPRDLNSQFASEALENYSRIKQIYSMVTNHREIRG
jgi:glycosyltransferase involved in cell wall biosynthesis